MSKTKGKKIEVAGKSLKLNNDLDKSIDKKLADVAYRFDNYHKIPPIIGMVIADQYGNTILVAEYNRNSSNFGPIKSYLSEDDKNLLEIDLISMYFSSLKTFAGQTNIKNLSHLQIYGSNIKVQIYFMFNKYMLILFLNSNTDLKPKEKANIIDYFKLNFEEYEYEFDNFNLTESRKIISSLEKQSKNMLRKLNNDYLQNYQRLYSKKHEIIEKIIIEIEPIIQEELTDCLDRIPTDILDNTLKEITSKIQDKLFDIQKRTD